MATAKLPTTLPVSADVAGAILGIPKNEWTSNGTTTAAAAVPFSLVVNEAIDAAVESTGYLTTENNEVLHYSAVNTGTKTFTIDARAQQGTTAAEIANGSTVGQYLTRDAWQQLAAEVLQMAKTGSGAKGADVASAAALNIGEDGHYFDVTGTTTITSIEARLAGQIVILQFDGALTLTHGAALVLQGATNMTTAAGDIVAFISEGSGNWRELSRRTAAVGGVTRTRNIFIPATAFVANAGGPSFSVRTYYVPFAFDAAATEGVATQWAVPEDYASGAATVKLWWTSPGAVAGNVVWKAYFGAVAAGEVLNPPPTLATNSNTIASPLNELLAISTLTSSVTPLAGEIFTIAIERTGGDGADTLAGDAWMVGVEIEYTAND